MESSPPSLTAARPGGHQLRPEVIAHHQRERLLDAVIELVAERGYRAVTVADIVKAGKVARGRFYENFASKQECFLAAYDRACSEALSRVGRASEEAGESFPARVSAAIAALLAYMEERPALARACLLEAPQMGEAMQGHHDSAAETFAEILQGGREEAGGELPDSLEESVLGGLYWLLYQALLSGQPQRITDLQPELVEFALAPFLGAAAARSTAVD